MISQCWATSDRGHCDHQWLGGNERANQREGCEQNLYGAVGNEVTTCCHHVYDIIKVLRCHLTPQMASVSQTCTLSMAKWLFDLLSGTMLGK